METPPRYTDSPEPQKLNFDKEWQETLDKYTSETGITLPNILETAISPEATINMIYERNADSEVFKGLGIGMRASVTSLLYSARNFFSAIWEDDEDEEEDENHESEEIEPCIPACQFFAATVFLVDAAKDDKEKYEAVMDMLYGLNRFTYRLVTYIYDEMEEEVQRLLFKNLSSLLLTLGLATQLVKQGKLKRMYPNMLLDNTEVGKLMERLEKATVRNWRAISTGLLSACHGVLERLQESLRTDEKEGEAKLEMLNVIYRVANHVHAVGADFRSQKLYNVAHRESIDDRIDADYHLWLGAPDPFSIYRLLSYNCAPKTGEWLFEKDVYNEWKSQTNSFMWITGPSGCGKTYLCCNIFDNLLPNTRNDAIGVAQFYFDVYDADMQDFKNLVPALISHFALVFDEKCTPLLKNLYEKNGNGGQPAFYDDVLATLKDMLLLFKETYIIIDAVENCLQPEQLMEFLKTLKDWNMGGLHVLLASDFESSTYPVIQPLLTQQYDIKIADTNQDILLYLDHKTEEPGLKKWRERGREIMKEFLVGKADGIFQWVSSQLGTIKTALSSINSLRACLNTLEFPLDKSYASFFQNIEDMEEESNHRLLQWMAFCRAPIPVKAFAAGTEFSVESHKDAPFIDHMYTLINPEDVAVVFPSLTTRSYDGLYKCSHGSVRKFMLSNVVQYRDLIAAKYTAASSHLFIAKGCLAYLLQFDKGNSLDASIDIFPVALYAAKHWFHHVLYDGVLKNHKVQKQLRSLFRPNSPQFLNWIRLYNIDRGPQQKPIIAKKDFKADPLYYASHIGLVDVVKWLITEEHDVNVAIGVYGNPLQVASVNGHKEVVEVLLESGADVNAQCGYYGSALQAAAFAGFKDIVQTLLEKGADVNAQGGYYGDPLKAASQRRHPDIVQLLTDAGAENQEE
ncbi:hypothetical protein AX17_007296 [Amanita inopinata Kibby_2008]|nr:hypothetical protein AX17_007296 [Amanita inopinata Kibby_2008]